jgi:lysophospholipase L1-like esterase
MRYQVSSALVDHARSYADAFGIAGVDMSQALSDTSGQWQPRLSYDGAVHDVRLDDGVHISEDGSRRTSSWTVATLAQLWSRPQLESVI